MLVLGRYFERGRRSELVLLLGRDVAALYADASLSRLSRLLAPMAQSQESPGQHVVRCQYLFAIEKRTVAPAVPVARFWG